MSDYDYDLFVIGGGSGGVRAARVAASTGARVALAEDNRMGGTCVIRGCVPKKLMVFASSFREMMPEARAYGWELEDGQFEWPRFHEKLEVELDRLEAVYRKLLDGSGVEIFDSRAKVAGPNSVALADGRTASAGHILVATGGHPIRPEMANARFGMVSDDIFHMKELPKSILIVGGGYIACEFACILHGLGVEVTQFYRGAQILRGFDGEARGLIADAMEERGIDLHLGTNIVEMRPASEVGGKSGAEMGMPAEELGRHDHDEADAGAVAPVPMWVKGTNGMEKTFDRVLFATGRAPNTRDMGLEEAGVEIGRRGEILVDEYSRTTVPSIYAIGDVTNRVNLTPVAIREGMAFVETVFKDNPTPVDHELIPSAVFTQPELGTVGLTEEEAREQEPIDVYCTSFRPMRGSFAGKPDRVLMKLIVSKQTDKVLGCHIVADEAGEMIQLAGIAVKMGATKADFDRTVAVHPTMAEELVTMRDPMRSA
ncbi:FAD-dependent oxidoreductase [Ponticoccus sp. SC2-23]|uniref:FAD-dependent oxidoreductase n=1 Tax=Alexandriicola marinus TaxID=2081710 RepID=UPI000FDB7418|nr:FAD-dependent oxidoreductase [Alexandriicola marinus]MBM1219573.1 FAD-dependent oxidoreductase [Ponticoccus sp. SC6-9]MBM1223355.1 FAD-dependent oxidoreductase [Ponticoccus sp. SC6-15]MBM1229386.1 FAD-dependent oxidoreductase [Ponticoccus sp. SC6-38]MBM1232321.1 FAD-dependent oxidoreductase [Ponticoccus sp. SC6-45]MBM1237729.1 FAD-dependent oxidoreductase [Ponticoccus sp. SC6-49]MBM1241332.1 FAD-dependent oxidoreductase [Ponticoccus sp. SC2-64]MBM1245845.1 FAD-dependent oxidoreductase [Po